MRKDEFMILGHRGAMSYAPENTMQSFALALNIGANGLETDIHACKDGALVCVHNATVKVGEREHKIANMTLAELKALDFGNGERIVTLDEFLSFTKHFDIYLAIELKQRGIHADVIDKIKYYYKERSKITITSFDFQALSDSRKYDSSILLGWLTEYCGDYELNKLREIGAKQICPKAENIDPASVLHAQQLGFSVRAWGIKDEAAMTHALQCGVNGMTCNFPDILAQRLGYVRKMSRVS